MSRKLRDYTEDDKVYHMANRRKLKATEIATDLGITYSVYRKWVTAWDVGNGAAIGTIRKHARGYYRQSEAGWKYIPMSEWAELGLAACKFSNYKPVVQKKALAPKHEPTNPVKKYADRVHDPKVSFRIDSKTVIMIDADADRDAVIQKYKKAI